MMGNNNPRVRDQRKITTTLRIDVGGVELVSALAKHEAGPCRRCMRTQSFCISSGSCRS